MERLIEKDIRGHIAHCLDQAWQHLSAFDIAGPASLRVMLMLGNPSDEYLKLAGGYYGMGGAPGWLYILGWPSDEVIGKLAYCAVHEFHHQVRYHNVTWDPATVTVAEHVVAEGLAEAFVSELYGPSARGPWGASVEAFDLVIPHLNIAGMRHTPAYVLGDTAARRFGQEPKGIPDFAGYPVGLRLVEEHMAATGMTAAESSVLPAAHFVSKYQ